ncbi:hypothetical protein BpHYR1_009641 [Brachionus plicatilis]|uniref:Uncharacterized protein n=1 Tax=Brachionus plicatilis TaxID=10195 RepID=A0A3M7QUL3_BRAPC|nr:hypothetical protein BpHYR1_009641 [Brachionus plicatilis]
MNINCKKTSLVSNAYQIHIGKYLVKIKERHLTQHWSHHRFSCIKELSFKFISLTIFCQFNQFFLYPKFSRLKFSIAQLASFGESLCICEAAVLKFDSTFLNFSNQI